jgi:hypothetical protein
MQFSKTAEVVGFGQVISSLVDVVDALYLMGLSIDELHRAIDAGEVDRDSCTANNPPTDAGSRAHGTTVRVLRETKIPHEWAACSLQNFSTVVSPDQSMEIAVATGDRATGNPDLTPKTKNKKGELVRIGIRKNIRQMAFPFVADTAGKKRKRTADVTWFLLRSRQDDVVHCELSIPISLGDNGRVNEWGTRIILPDLVIGGRGGELRPIDSNADEANVDVPVLRRSAA